MAKSSVDRNAFRAMCDFERAVNQLALVDFADASEQQAIRDNYLRKRIGMLKVLPKVPTV